MIHITFFGDFSLRENDITLSARDSHAERLFRALAYLIKHRKKKIELAEFSRFLHDEKPYSKYKGDSLVKTTLHRLRELLSAFGREESILLSNGYLSFSGTMTFSSDAECFDEIAAEFATADEAEKLVLFEKATRLYQGRFLATFSGEGLTMPEAERYHRTFLSLCDEALGLLVERGDYQTAYRRARLLVRLDPYAECLHYHEIYALLLSGDKALASLLYRNVSLRYRREFHVLPSARLHALRALLEPTDAFPADSLDEALTMLEKAHREEKGFSQSTLSYPVDLVRLLPLIPEGYLVLLKGDVEKIIPELDTVFDKRTLSTRLSENALLLVTTLERNTLDARLRALEELIRYCHIKIEITHRKIETNKKK